MIFHASPFGDAEAASHAAIQDEFAELFIWNPMERRPNWPAIPDTTRTVQCVRATFFWEHHDQRLGLKEAHIVSRVPKLSIHRDEMIGVPRQADLFTRRYDGNAYEVTKVERDGLTGIMLELVQLGIQS